MSTAISNPTGCCVDTVDACGCTGIPQTLVATFTEAAQFYCGCTYLESMVLTNSGTNDWSGSASLPFGPAPTGYPCTSKTITLRLYCDSGVWKLDIGGCDTATLGGGVGGCPPLNFSTMTNIPGCCYPGNFVITITE